jgi:Ca2+-binding RTX toxin-like protein
MRSRSLVWFTAVAAAVVLVPGVAVSAHLTAINGTDGTDVLAGTQGSDRIVALAGNDRVHAKLGMDRVWAGEDNDTVHAGAARDTVYGGPGNDILYGGGGNDRIFAQRGVDLVYGHSGNDDLWAMARRDVTHTLNEPADTLTGGLGNDSFHVRDGEADRVNCGAGYDVVIADRRDIVTSACERVVRRPPGNRKTRDD